MEAFEDDDWQPPTEAELKVIQAKRERQNKISKLMGDYLLKGYKMLSNSCPECETILLRDKQGVDYCVACKELDSDNIKDDPALSSEAARRQAQEQSQRTSAEQTPSDDELQMLPGVSMESRMLPGSLPMPGVAMETRPGGAEARPGFGERMGENFLGSRSEHVPVSVRLARPEGPDVTMVTRQLGSDRFPEARGCDTLNPLMVRNAESISGGLSDPPQDDRRVPKLTLRHSSSGHPRGHVQGVETTVSSALSALQSKMTWAVYELNHTSHIERSTQLCQLIKSAAEATEAIRKAYPPKS